MRARIESIVTLVLAAVACGGNTETSDPAAVPATSPSPSPEGERKSTIAPFPDDATFACATPLAPLAPGLRPGVPVDYLELRGPLSPNADMDAGAAPFESKTGVPCAKASTPDACLTKLASTRVQGWGEASCGPPLNATQFLVYTRGDEVGTAANEAEVVALLAPIDTEEEARLVLAARGLPLRCVDGAARNGVRRNADGSYEIIVTYGGCPTTRTRFKIEPSGALSTVASQDDGASCMCGRRFEGLAEGPSGGAAHGLGAYFAELAYLEAASVTAFRRFGEELARFGAPPTFVVRAGAARRDEVRHAATMARLARRFGGELHPVEAEPVRMRSAFDVALENAVEGCVRETYGALVAAYQARTAADPEIRRVMARVAADEAAHAGLAHEVAAWLEPRLAPAERDAIAHAKRRAAEELFAAVDAPVHPEVREGAGLPDAAAARRLLEALPTLTAHAA